MTKSLTKTRAEHMSVHGRQHFQLIVDVHLLLLSNDQVLLGRRSNTGYGDGAYEPPSGHLDDKETVVESAVRVAAEAGIALDPARVSLAHVMHDVSGAGRIAFFLTADSWDGPIADAADGYSDLAWFPLDLLPANMMDRARVAIRDFAAGARFSTYPCFSRPIANPAPLSAAPRGATRANVVVAASTVEEGVRCRVHHGPEGGGRSIPFPSGAGY